jgi:hypothetical protein
MTEMELMLPVLIRITDDLPGIAWIHMEAHLKQKPAVPFLQTVHGATYWRAQRVSSQQQHNNGACHI